MAKTGPFVILFFPCSSSVLGAFSNAYRMQSVLTSQEYVTRHTEKISKLLASYRRAQQELQAEDEQDALADCSGDEKGETLADSDLNESKDALADCSGDELTRNQVESSDDEDDEELRNLMKKKETLEEEKQRLQSERQQRRMLREQRKRQLLAEVQDLEEEIKELSVGPYVPGYRR